MHCILKPNWSFKCDDRCPRPVVTYKGPAVTFKGQAIKFRGLAITFEGAAITFKGPAITFWDWLSPVITFKRLREPKLIHDDLNINLMIPQPDQIIDFQGNIESAAKALRRGNIINRLGTGEN